MLHRQRQDLIQVLPRRMGTGGGGCCVTNTTSALMAQGTVIGVVLAGLVWFGVGIIGGLLLWLLLMVLLGILCSLFDCVCSWTGCEPDCGSCCPGPCAPCPDPCCPCPDPCCDPCGSCCGDCGCGGGSSSGGGGCGDCGDCGDCGCEGGSGGGGGGGTGEVPAGGVLLPGSAAAAALALRGRRVDLAHHPDLPRYRADVYRLAGRRLCIGCFTTYPLFLLVGSILFLVHPPIAWSTALGVGFALASLQGMSSLGLTKTKPRKVLVKSGLGIGLALYTFGALQAPFGFWGRYALLGGALVLAMASAIPRSLRMRRERLARGEPGCTCTSPPKGR